MGRKHCGKRRKCWLPAFLLFPQCFKAFFLRVVISQDCAVKGYNDHAEQFAFEKLGTKQETLVTSISLLSPLCFLLFKMEIPVFE